MVSPTFVAATATDTSTTTTGTVPLPAGWAAGDMFVAQVSYEKFDGANGPSPFPTILTPSGWTLRGTSTQGAGTTQAITTAAFTRTAQAGDTGPNFSASFTVSGIQWSVQIAAYRNAVAVDTLSTYTGVAVSKATIPSVTPAGSGGLMVGVVGVNTYSVSSSGGSGSGLPSGWTARVGSSYGRGFIADAPAPSAGTASTPASTTAFGYTGSVISFNIVLRYNTAPNAPTLNSPATNAMIDRGATQRFAWTFSDPDAGDSQSAFDLQYWDLDGSGARVGSAHSVSQTTTNAYWDAPAGTFSAGNKEWQVRTYDAAGVQGPWSPLRFFIASNVKVHSGGSLQPAAKYVYTSGGTWQLSFPTTY